MNSQFLVNAEKNKLLKKGRKFLLTEFFQPLCTRYISCETQAATYIRAHVFLYHVHYSFSAGHVSLAITMVTRAILC